MKILILKKMYKVLILKNKISNSLKSQIKDIIDFYKDIEPLEITEKKVSLKQQYEIQKYYTNTGTIDMEVISESWLKSIVPSGYDIVIFISKEWKCDFLGGFNFMMSNNPKLIIVRYIKGDTFTFIEGNESTIYQGDKLSWTIIHEISHALCNLKGLPDLTHKYYLLGTPKDCFKTMKVAILTRQKGDNKQTLGELVCTNGSNEFKCKTLELADKNNQRNISCIPKGVYKVKKIFSIKFGNVYEVQNIPNRSSIYIHQGNYYTDIQGCILVGNGFSDINKDSKLDVINSKITRKALESFFNGESFTLIIK